MIEPIKIKFSATEDVSKYIGQTINGYTKTFAYQIESFDTATMSGVAIQFKNNKGILEQISIEDLPIQLV
jgi:hypothetical protein